MDSEKGPYQLTIRGLGWSAAKRIAEAWAGGAMVWDNGVAYPSREDQPFVIEKMPCQPALTECPTCRNDFRKCTALTPNVGIQRASPASGEAPLE